MVFRYTILTLSLLFMAKDSSAQLEWLIDPIIEYDNFAYYPHINEDFIIVKPTSGKTGIINKELEIICHPDSFANIQFTEGNGVWKGFKKGRKPVYFNNSGKVLSEAYDRISNTYRTNVLMIQKDKLFGLIDTSGNVIQKPIFKDIKRVERGVYEGTLPNKKVKTITLEETNGKSPRQEKKSIQINSQQIKDRIVFNRPSGKRNFRYWGMKDTNGNVVVKADRYYSNYNKMHFEQQIMIAIDATTDKHGVIDHQGKIIIPFEHVKIKPALFAGKMVVAINEGKYGAVDFNNETMLPFEYEMIFPSQDDNIAIITKSGKTGVVDAEFNPILPMEYESIHKLNDHILQLKKDGFIGFYSLKTNKLTKPRFTKTRNLSKGTHSVTEYQQLGVLDVHSGTMLTDTIYKSIKRKNDYFLVETLYYETIKADTTTREVSRVRHAVLNARGEEVFVPGRAPAGYLINDLFVTRTAKNDTVIVRNLKLNTQKIFKGEGMVFKKDEANHGILPVTQIQKNRYCFTDELLKPNPEIYEFIGPKKDNIRIYKKEGMFGLIYEKQPITGAIYEAIKDIAKGMVKVKLNGRWGVLKNPFYEEK